MKFFRLNALVDSIKNRLDKFWANEEARFDYKANLSGSGFARLLNLMLRFFYYAL